MLKLLSKFAIIICQVKNVTCCSILSEIAKCTPGEEEGEATERRGTIERGLRRRGGDWGGEEGAEEERRGLRRHKIMDYDLQNLFCKVHHSQTNPHTKKLFSRTANCKQSLYFKKLKYLFFFFNWPHIFFLIYFAMLSNKIFAETNQPIDVNKKDFVAGKNLIWYDLIWFKSTHFL